MGAGIARVFAEAGRSVRLMRSACGDPRGRPRATRRASGSVRLTTSLDEALDGAGLVVETIVEEAEPKRELLARAEEVARRRDPDDEHVLASAGRARRRPLGDPSASPGCTGSTRRSWSSSSKSSAPSAPRRRRSTPSSRWMEQLGKAPDRRPPRRARLRRQPPPVRAAARGLRAGRRGRLLVRRRRPRGHARPRRPLGGDRPVRDDGPRGARRPRRGRGEPLAGAVATRASRRASRSRARSRPGALGVKSGRGLRGEYSPGAAAAPRARRDRVLRGLRALRARRRSPARRSSSCRRASASASG